MKLVAGVVAGGGEGFRVGGGGVERRGIFGVGRRSLCLAWVGEAVGGGSAWRRMTWPRASSAFHPARRGTWACLPAA